MSYSKKGRWLAVGLISLSGFAFVESQTQALKMFKISKFFRRHTKVYNPVDEIAWTNIKNYGGVADMGSKQYVDVISHTNPNDTTCPRSNGMSFSLPSIRVHETQHMLHCQISRPNGQYDEKIQGLYYKDGKGIILTKPKAKVTDFSYRIPSALREAPSPYQTYIIGQMTYPSLNNMGYLFNEWGSYISNIKLNLELEKSGIPEGDAEGHAANYSPHFFGYLAIGMHHLQELEPEALQDKQLKATFALYSEETWKLMHAALNSPVFGKENTFYGSQLKKVMDFYRNSPEFAEIKKSLVTLYGKEWVDNLMK